MEGEFIATVEMELNEKGQGYFFIREDQERIALMEVSMSGDLLIAAHTEVLPKAEGKGLARQLLNSMVGYARDRHLKVMPLCPYVHAQFKRRPDEYQDIWQH